MESDCKVVWDVDREVVSPEEARKIADSVGEQLAEQTGESVESGRLWGAGAVGESVVQFVISVSSGALAGLIVEYSKTRAETRDIRVEGGEPVATNASEIEVNFDIDVDVTVSAERSGSTGQTTDESGTEPEEPQSDGS